MCISYSKCQRHGGPLSKDRESGGSHYCSEEIETVFSGSQNPGKNQLSCTTSLEEAQSILNNGNISVGALRV